MRNLALFSEVSGGSVEGLKEMADVVGVDHVSVGTDQQVRPGSLQDYAQSGAACRCDAARGFHTGRGQHDRGR